MERDLSVIERYNAIVALMRSKGWAEVLGRVKQRGNDLYRELVERDLDEKQMIQSRSMLRILKWVAELPTQLEENLRSQVRFAAEEGAPGPNELGHPYGPIPGDEQPPQTSEVERPTGLPGGERSDLWETTSKATQATRRPVKRATRRRRTGTS